MTAGLRVVPLAGVHRDRHVELAVRPAGQCPKPIAETVVQRLAADHRERHDSQPRERPYAHACTVGPLPHTRHPVGAGTPRPTCH